MVFNIYAEYRIAIQRCAATGSGAVRQQGGCLLGVCHARPELAESNSAPMPTSTRTLTIRSLCVSGQLRIAPALFCHRLAAYKAICRVRVAASGLRAVRIATRPLPPSSSSLPSLPSVYPGTDFIHRATASILTPLNFWQGHPSWAESTSAAVYVSLDRRPNGPCPWIVRRGTHKKT